MVQTHGLSVSMETSTGHCREAVSSQALLHCQGAVGGGGKSRDGDTGHEFRHYLLGFFFGNSIKLNKNEDFHALGFLWCYNYLKVGSGLASFYMKSQVVNIFGFWDHMVFTKTTQLCYCSMRPTMSNT
jgi:hypothetical protein